jgi:WD40 repeat protein
MTMGRFFLTVALGLGICFGLAYWLNLWPGGGFAAPPIPPSESQGDAPQAPVTLGEALYAFKKPASTLVPPDDFKENLLGRIIVVPGQFAPMDKVELGAEVSGTLLFVGEEIPEGIVAVAGLAPFTADPFRIMPLNLGQNQVVYKVYRRLHEGMTVEPDQMVALLNPAKSMLDVNMKYAKYYAAIAEKAGSEALYEESKATVEANVGLHNKGSISREEYRRSVMTMKKYYQEVKGKEEGIKLAWAELNISEHLLKQHEVRNKIRLPRSTVKQVLKNTGDTVKESEPILQLFNTEFLLAEGLLDATYMDNVRKAHKIVIEPTREEGPMRILKAHRQEVTGVAVTRDNKIVSGSRDGRVFVWSLDQTNPIWQWETRREEVERIPKPLNSVTAVASSPPGCKERWALAGCADGAVYLFNLDKPQEVRRFKEHRDAVTSLAFSPDGSYFATGGAENLIQLWKTAKVWDKEYKPEYPFEPGHIEGQAQRGTITALHFTPDGKLISASRDLTLSVWALHANGAKLERREEGRGGAVGQLSVSADGNWMLFDKQKGKELQILSTQGVHYCNLDPPQTGTGFSVLAEFSPDSNLLLTAGGAEGRLQLWRTPTNQSRGFELRQYAPKEGAPVTCAAFAPDGRFIASGSQDHHVYIWTVPTNDEIKNHRLTAKRVHLPGALDSSPRQIRMSVELDNPDGLLLPGRPVTIVVYE